MRGAASGAPFFRRYTLRRAQPRRAPPSFRHSRASRRVFKGELPNHQLQTVAARCGYDLALHHHALADAEACAQIALQIL